MKNACSKDFSDKTAKIPKKFILSKILALEVSSFLTTVECRCFAVLDNLDFSLGIANHQDSRIFGHRNRALKSYFAGSAARPRIIIGILPYCVILC